MPKNKYIGYDDVVFRPGSMVDTLSLSSALYPEVAERMAKQDDAFKTTSDYFITPRRFVKPTKLTSLLDSEYTGRAPGSPAYLTDITDDVTEGSAMLYPHGYINDTGYYFFRDKNNGRYYTLSKSEAPEVINPDNFERISYDDIRKVLPAREYIGGPNYRRVVASRIPGFTDAVYKKAKDWGLDPNLMMHRIFKEGFIDSVASGYNDLATSKRQKTYFDEDYSERDLDGFHDFGLDDAGDMLDNKIYTLNDPSATWDSLGAINESGREVHSVIGHGLNSILEIIAADLNYRRNKVKELYNVDDADADRYTNAAFNRGLYSDKLNDHDFIVNEYSYPQYYNEDGTFNVKADGGLLDRILHVYGNDTQSIRQAISGIKANTFRKGGRIFIKPENRGKFTALKKRTGHSASWFKAHGTPAQKKMAVFELNSRKWKHADGGPLLVDPDDDYVYMGMLPDVEITAKEMPEWRKKWRRAMRTPLKVPAVAPNPTSVATWQYDTNNLVDTTLGNELAYTGALFGAVPAMALGSELWAIPQVRNAVDVIGAADAVRNQLSDNGIKKTVGLVKEGRYGRAALSGLGDAFDILGGVDIGRRLGSKVGQGIYKTLTNTGFNSPFSISQDDLYQAISPLLAPKEFDAGIRLYHNVVNADGSINRNALLSAYRDVLRYANANSPVGTKISAKTPYHSSQSGTTNLAEHTRDVVRSAQSIPVPSGSDRATLVRSALAHDIGKLILGQDKAHGIASRRILENIDWPEFHDRKLLSAINYHMDDSFLPIYKSHGDDFVRVGNDAYPMNYDLLHALQASDVARGLEYDQAAMRYPQLFTYAKANPFDIQIGRPDPDWEFKNIVNPILRRQGYPTVHNMDELSDVMKRHRSFYRGVRDPMKQNGSRDNIRNADNAQFMAIAEYGDNTPETRMKVSLEQIPMDPTGSGRATLFGTRTSDGITEHVPGSLSTRLKISPYYQDALYVSASPRVLKEYATASDARDVMAARVTMPLIEAPTLYDSPANFLARNEFQLYDGSKVINSKTPMSNWQMFEEPYRLQTGRSLQSDMAKEFTGNKYETIKSSKFVTDDDLISKYNDIKSNIVKAGNKFGVDFSDMFPITNRGMLAPLQANGILRPLERLANAANNTDNFNIVIPGAIARFTELGVIPKKLRNVYIAKLNKYRTAEQEIRRYENYASTYPGMLYANTSTKEQLWAKSDEAYEALRKFFYKYIATPSTFRKAKSALYKSMKSTSRISREYKGYLSDSENQLKFLREHGYSPLWEMPYFGKTELLSTNGTSFGYKPKTRNVSAPGNDPQAILVDDKGARVFDSSRIPIDELRKFLNENKGLSKRIKRDSGKRYSGEDPLFSVTRKTFSDGGAIQRALDSNKADVVKAAILKLKSDVTS